MRTTITQPIIPSAVGATQIQVQRGKQVRILAITMAITPAAQGDQVTIDWQRGGVSFMLCVSEPLPTSVGNMSASIGANGVGSLQASFDPVTGIYTYAFQQHGQLALPNVHVPFEFALAISMAAGTVDSGTLLYELSDAGK